MAQPLTLDEAGEGFIERGVPRYVQPLVGQFVEDQRREAIVASTQHGVEDGIVEPAQGGVGLDAADPGVQPLLTEQGSRTPGPAQLVVAAIGDATGDGKAVGLRLQGKLVGGEQVPDHVGPADIGIDPIAAVIRQA
ncbi:hypothetical protein FQZ97_966720 [compost metagenome]